MPDNPGNNKLIGGPIAFPDGYIRVSPPERFDNIAYCGSIVGHYNGTTPGSLARGFMFVHHFSLPVRDTSKVTIDYIRPGDPAEAAANSERGILMPIGLLLQIYVLN